MAEKGTKENPYTSLEELKKSNAYYAGKKAVSEVEKRLGRRLSPEEKRIVELEGFVDAYYTDDRGVTTRGVGQTGDYAAGDTSLSGFDKAYQEHLTRLKAREGMGKFGDYSPTLRQELVQAEYRGDLGQSPTFRKLLFEAKTTEDYNKAADEFLNNQDYLTRKTAGGDGVTERIEAVADAVRKEGAGLDSSTSLYDKGLGAIQQFRNYLGFKKGGNVNKITTPMIDVSTDRLPYDRLQEMARRSMMLGNEQDRMDDYDYAREQAQRPYVNRYPVDAQGRGAYSTAAPMGMQAQRMMGFADGGPVDNAQGLASLGRGGDSMLVHMQPQEVAGLQRLAEQSGTSLTKNPYTGMPEAFSLGGVLKAAVPVAAGYFAGPAGAGLVSGMGGAMGVGALTGAAIAAASGDDPIFGAISGGMGGASGFGLGEALGAGAVSAGPGGWDPATGAVQSLSNQQALNMTTAGQAGAIANAPPVNAPNFNATVINKTPRSLGFSDFYDNPGKAFEQTQVNLGKNVPTGGFNPKTGDPRTIFQPATKLQAAMKLGSPVGSALMGGIEESDLMPDTGYLDDARARDKYDPTKRLNLNMDTGISEALKRDSGLRLLAQGGYLDGGRIGDGMSDSVHANIDGQQEARLSEGEFVVPADVVSHLGNGSSDAGAQRLYSMMDKVRKARTGTKQQGRQIDPRKYMPR
jgi:hypothetical protein